MTYCEACAAFVAELYVIESEEPLRGGSETCRRTRRAVPYQHPRDVD
jgi:hypothetical protein